MDTHMTELSIDEMEMVNVGDLKTKLLHVAGGLGAMAVGMVLGPVGAITVGLTYVAAEIAIDKMT